MVGVGGRMRESCELVLDLLVPELPGSHCLGLGVVTSGSKKDHPHTKRPLSFSYIFSLYAQERSYPSLDYLTMDRHL